MTREEKIALLVDELEDIRCDNFDADTNEDKTLKEAVRVIKALEQEPRWIPVSERLPEKNGYYLTTNRYHEVYSDYWEGTCFDCTDVVIAWMPLPKPYEPQESEE